MAPRAKRKLEATEWATMDVDGLTVEWKLTASGMVRFKWDGSAKQTLTLTKEEDAQDAPRRVRAQVENESAAKAASKGNKGGSWGGSTDGSSADSRSADNRFATWLHSTSRLP
jgi:hypothetical protein